MITRYHANYYARVLAQRAVGGDIDSLSQSLLNAAVDINPHQIEAALFAFRSPLSKGIILADEVGLGKTIEAGLVLCQHWAIGKRKIIVVCPAAIRKQWGFELSEKFGIDYEILDTKNYNEYIRNGRSPFSTKKVVICSYNFAARKKDEIRLFGFDLAVIDEAHKLRNVYKKNSLTAHAVRDALENVKKLLLTATPFQNSLMELYGLTSVIDENVFGDAKSFRTEYVNEGHYSDLQMRLSPYYKRTLRKDVVEYISYTKRLPFTQQFDSSDLEYDLYTKVSEFLRSDTLYSIPAKQKMLTTMIVRKILASSTYALLGTLTTIKTRLEKILDENKIHQLDFSEIFDEDAVELIAENEEDVINGDGAAPSDDEKINAEAIKEEIAAIQDFIDIAEQIQHDSKSKALLTALKNAFEQLSAIGANSKALIFTESTRTQAYLKEYLEQNGYRGKIVIFNGSNSDKHSNAILQSWLQTNAYNGKASGIRAADRRAAVVDYFKNSAEIMIATEAAAEGLNLQFCSLVVNYDLPWNPQRIEQRIGRCHRYGQKSDVVVVNFVNRRNYADQRVFNLLNDKFKLFNDVFGASDEVLGQIDGVDFEKRIWLIYQECRTESEISAAFERLQAELESEISTRLEEVKEQVLKTFDVEVQERLKLAKETTSAFMGRYEYIFWELTKYVLDGKAEFDDAEHSFTLKERVAESPKGKYRLISGKAADGIPYRLSHPLAQYVVSTASAIDITGGKIQFSPTETALNVTLPDNIKGKSGYLLLSSLDVSAFDTEQYTLFTAYTADGEPLPQELCEKMFLCAGREIAAAGPTPLQKRKLAESAEQHRKGKLQQIDSRNLSYFKEEEDRIFRWEKDLINSLENELDTVKRQIREQERAVRNAVTMEEKIEATKKLDELERSKRRKRNNLAEHEDEIAGKRRKLLSDLDARMIKQTRFDDIFAIEWQII
ncbi:MAG: ATP-dependent helicase [Clostridia bacterium]|nr:ATP-dependent helicase [Clostridia bacterium]